MTTTPNLELELPTYNSTGWHTAVNGNFSIIDAALSQFFVQANFEGRWANLTAYAEDDVVVDATNSNIYTCQVAHTSPASPTTFATYRTANPSHWSNTTNVAASGRGAWATGEEYVKGDFVVEGTEYAVCTANHTAGATFAGDSANWEILIDVSAAVVADGSINNAKFANPLTIPGATTITAGGLTITAGGLIVSANATTLQGTTIASGGLSVTAGGIGVTAGGINITAGGLIVQAGGIAVTGNSTIAGTLGGLTGLTVASGGATITTGGLTVSANGATIVGNSTITGTLGGLTGLTVASGGATITAGGLTVTAGGITVSSGGVNITGDSTITGVVSLVGATSVTGALSATTTITGASLIPSGATAPTNGIHLPAANTVGIATNSTERVRYNASGAWGIAGANYGTAGQILTSAGSAAVPTWGDAPVGIAVIESGSLGTSTECVINDIPETYSHLILSIIGASCTQNRTLVIRASEDNGVTGLATDLIDVAGFAGGLGNLTEATVYLYGYQTGPVRAHAQSFAEDNSPASNNKTTMLEKTSNIDAFRITWSGAGDFDAGTYVLYGVK